MLWCKVSLDMCGIMAEAWVEGSALLLTSPMALDRMVILSISSSVNGTIIHILPSSQLCGEDQVNKSAF